MSGKIITVHANIMYLLFQFCLIFFVKKIGTPLGSVNNGSVSSAETILHIFLYAETGHRGECGILINGICKTRAPN